MLCKITPDSSGLPRYEDRSKFLRIHPITHPMVTRKYLLAPLLLLVLCLLSPSSCAGLELLTDGSRGGPGPPPSGSLSVSFIDVGQGDAVLVQAGGESYLIDAGRPEEGPNVVDFLRSRSVDSLDGIVVTNPRS
jgi:competence protein ComEC